MGLDDEALQCESYYRGNPRLIFMCICSQSVVVTNLIYIYNQVSVVQGAVQRVLSWQQTFMHVLRSILHKS